MQRHLLVALQDYGTTLVPHGQADFTLTYWLDDSWETGKKVVYCQNGDWSNIQPLPIARTYRAPGQVVYPASPIVGQRIAGSDYYVQGIRLKLYPKNGAGGVEFKTAWESYIEGGARVSNKREPMLLRTPLDYFGQDFTGRAPLIDRPD